MGPGEAARRAVPRGRRPARDTLLLLEPALATGRARAHLPRKVSGSADLRLRPKATAPWPGMRRVVDDTDLVEAAGPQVAAHTEAGGRPIWSYWQTAAAAGRQSEVHETSVAQVQSAFQKPAARKPAAPATRARFASTTTTSGSAFEKG